MSYVRKNDDKEWKTWLLEENWLYLTLLFWFDNFFYFGRVCHKANFPQEATFFILCHRFFLHSSLFKSCCHTTFEYLSYCWDWASLLERAATAAASQQLTELKFKFGREALSTQQSCKKNWWQTNFEHLFEDLFDKKKNWIGTQFTKVLIGKKHKSNACTKHTCIGYVIISYKKRDQIYQSFSNVIIWKS